MKKAGFNPRTLFSASEPGAWYDPSDLSTLFQDSAGTVPVTAVEQPVGRILDKSGRGNHATQATALNRPVLSAKVNLLLNTETLSTQTATTAATSQTLRFEGAGSITLSGTATGTYSAGAHTFTTTAGTLTLTVSGSVTSADLRASNDGVGLPSYQRVNTATDYDTAGFPLHLRFNGTNQWLQTGNIDFTGTDKISLWAGYRKLALGTQLLAGVSDIDAASAKFGLFAEIGTNPNAARLFSSGSENANYSAVTSPSSFPPPLTLTIVATGSISGRRNELFVNGVSVGVNTADQGSGNHGNLPLFIGSTLGTSRRFNGKLFGLIIRGAASNATQITQTEAWVNGKTGAYA